MSKILIAIDPGKASGYAVLNFTDINDVKIIESDELEQYETVAATEKRLSGWVFESDVIEVVMEKFTVTAQTGKNTNGQNWSSEIIGAVRYLAQKHGARFTEQTPAEAKSFIPNERLKAIGLWHKGGEGHARDALRHGGLYLIKHHAWRPAGLLDS